MRRVWIGEEEKRTARRREGKEGNVEGDARKRRRAKWEVGKSRIVKGETTRNREYEADGYINSCPNPKEEMLSGLVIRH
jgi:hypothetical protein